MTNCAYFPCAATGFGAPISCSIGGSWCAMPLWQSMQVLLSVNALL
jgi:hypothetical protein